MGSAAPRVPCRAHVADDLAAQFGVPLDQVRARAAAGEKVFEVGEIVAGEGKVTYR